MAKPGSTQARDLLIELALSLGPLRVRRAWSTFHSDAAASNGAMSGAPPRRCTRQGVVGTRPT